MNPLPERPQFPVFGLADSFDGFRWLLMWQRRVDPWTGHVTEVDLAHGHPDDGPFIVVRTVLKQPVRDLGDNAFAGPIGLEHLASNLVGHALDRSGSVEDDHALRAHEQELIEETTDGGAVLLDWSIGTVSIDGVDVEARTRDINHARVAVVEFPTHVVGVVGPARLLIVPALADVSAGLHVYRAGSDEWADSRLR